MEREGVSLRHLGLEAWRLPAELHVSNLLKEEKPGPLEQGLPLGPPMEAPRHQPALSTCRPTGSKPDAEEVLFQLIEWCGGEPLAGGIRKTAWGIASHYPNKEAAL